MQMLYNSDAFAVMEIAVPADDAAAGEPARLSRGGYEIVDKLAQADIYLEGAIAQHFKEGVEALARQESSIDQIDEFISRYTALQRQPLHLH